MIDSSVLHATDIDSDDDMLIYTITQLVHRGQLYKLSVNDTEQDVVVFTPSDLQSGKSSNTHVYVNVVRCALLVSQLLKMSM